MSLIISIVCTVETIRSSYFEQNFSGNLLSMIYIDDYDIAKENVLNMYKAILFLTLYYEIMCR